MQDCCGGIGKSTYERERIAIIRDEDAAPDWPGGQNASGSTQGKILLPAKTGLLNVIIMLGQLCLSGKKLAVVSVGKVLV